MLDAERGQTAAPKVKLRRFRGHFSPTGRVHLGRFFPTRLANAGAR